MKVFRMSDYEWWVAPSIEDAVASYMETTGERCDNESGFPQELSDEDLDTLTIAECDQNENPTGEKMTFREYLPNFTKAGFFCGTDW